LDIEDAAQRRRKMFTAAKKDGIAIPDAQFWTDLRAAYRQIKEVGGQPVDDDDPWLKAALVQEWPLTGALIEYEVRLGEYGRGVYSKQTVPAGTPVWKCQHCGVFTTEQQWLAFLKLLPHHMQYDVVQWAFASDGVVYLDLEPATMFNHGGTFIAEEVGFSNVRPDNVICQKVEINPNESNDDEEYQYVAKVDINVGDELLCDYSEFHDYANPLSWFVASHAQIVGKGIYY
jgi:hypothetical protein